MENCYTVILVGGDRDGEELGYFKTERDAVTYAHVYLVNHEADLHTVWGGLMILDPEGKEVYF